MKPTREQRKTLSRHGARDPDWMVVKDTPTEIVIFHREKRIMKTIRKI